MPLDIVVQGAPFTKRHPDQFTLGLFGRLADGLGHLTRFAGTETDPSAAVSDHNQGRETEPPTTLNHFSDAIDPDQLVE